MTALLFCSVGPRAALTGTQLQSRASPCQIIRGRGRKQNYRESLGSTAGADTPSLQQIWWVVFLLEFKKKNVFSPPPFVCLSLNQTKLGLYFNSLSPSQRWLTTLITALKLMDTKADCGHRDTILNGQSQQLSSSVSDTEISQFIKKRQADEITASSSSHEEEVQWGEGKKIKNQYLQPFIDQLTIALHSLHLSRSLATTRLSCPTQHTSCTGHKIICPTCI